MSSVCCLSVCVFSQDSVPPHPDRLTWLHGYLLPLYSCLHRKFSERVHLPPAGWPVDHLSRLRCPPRHPPRPPTNIPILSYLLLCVVLSGVISRRYPVVEALTGALFVLVLYHTGPGRIFPLLVYAAFVAALVVVTFIDLDHPIIPTDQPPGIVIGLLLAVLGYGPGVVESVVARCWVAASSTRSRWLHAFTAQMERDISSWRYRRFLGGKKCWSPSCSRSFSPLIGIASFSSVGVTAKSPFRSAPFLARAPWSPVLPIRCALVFILASHRNCTIKSLKYILILHIASRMQ